MKTETKYLIGAGIAVGILGVYLYYKNKPKFTKEVMDEIKTKVWDNVSETNINKLHPKVREKAREFINKAEKEGIKLRVTSTLRTYDEQNKLYAKGRTDGTKGIVTNAKGGFSNHNFGTALDVVPIVDGKADWKAKNWDKIGEIGKSVGFDWGGDWKGLVDKPHFEMQFGNTLAQLRQAYESGNVTNGYVNIT